MAQLQTTAVTGSLTVTGNITAQTLVVQTITSSVSVVTGSTQFGSLTSNTHQFTGSILQSGSLAYFGGKVSIGSDFSDGALNVWSKSNSVAQFLGYAGTSIQVPAFGFYAYNINSTDGGLDIKTSNAGVFTDTVRITYNQNVGIGTTSPNAKLDISAGTLSLYSKAAIINADITTNNSPYTQTLQLTNNTTAEAPTSIGFGNYTHGLIKSRQMTANLTAGGLDFYTRTTTSEPDVKMTLTNAGNVGIGTTVPTGSLHVAGATTTLGAMQIVADTIGGPAAAVVFKPTNASSVNTGFQFQLNPGGGAYGYFQVINTDPGINQPLLQLAAYGLSGDSYINVPQTTQNFSLRVNTSTKFYLQGSSGNVGIGTTAPTYTLQVGRQTAGDNNDYAIAVSRHGTGASPGSWTSQPAITIQDQTDGGPSAVDVNGLFNISLGRFDFTDTNATNATLLAFTYDGTIGPMRVDGRGNTWIGYDRGAVPTNSGAFSLLVRNGISVGSSYQSTTPPSNGAIIQGNVGIGTTNPVVKLVISNGGAAGMEIDPGSSSADGGTLIEHYNRSTSAYVRVRTIALSHLFETNAAEVMRIVGANVGIGTSNPLSKLHIQASEPTLRIVDSDDSGTMFIGNTGGYSYIRPFSRDFRFLNAAGSSLMAITSGGNVGIDTTTPGYKLDVKGTGYFDGPLYVGTTSNRNYFDRSSIRLTDSTSNVYVLDINVLDTQATIQTNYYGGGANIPLELRSYGNSAQLYLATSGNVGIGTTSPVVTFDVQSTVTGTYNTTTQQVVSRFYNNPASLGSGNNSAFISIQASPDGGNSNPIARIGVVGESYGTNLGSFVVATRDAGGITERMRVTSAGNVGIGTTSPATLLQVGSSAVSSGITSLRVYGFDGAADFYTTREESPYNTAIQLHNNPSAAAGATGISFRARSSSTDSRVQAVIYSAWTTSTDASRTSKLVFQTVDSAGTASDKVTILGNGNIGIGTTVPAAKLQVSGSTNTVNFKGSGSAVFSVDGTAGRLFQVDDSLSGSLFSVNTVAGLPVIEAFSDYSVNLGTYSAVSGSTMRITGSSVGIGTTSPDAQLVINSVDPILKLRDIASTNVMFVGVSSTGGYVRNFANETFRVLNAAGTTQVIVNSNGNVGIGTTSPSQKLHIHDGDIAITSTYSSGTNDILFSGGSTTGGANNTTARIRNTSTAPGGAATGDLLFTVNSGDTFVNALYIATNGNVGIGTTAPKTILDVYNNSDIWHFMVGGGTSKLLVAGQATGGIILQGGAASTANNTFVTNPYNIILQRDGGNVGIGTTNAIYKFYVNGDGQIGAAYFSSTDATFNSTNFTVNSSNITVGNNTTDNVYVGQSTLNVIGGNVGIGTTNPSQKLEVVAGIIKVSGAGNSFMFENRSVAGNTWEWYSQGSVGSSFAGLYKNYNTTGTPFVVTDTGNVGIGTTSPSSILHINSTNPIIKVETPWSSGNYGQIRLGYVAGTNRSITGHYDDGMTFDVNGERMRINTSGYIFINSTSVTTPALLNIKASAADGNQIYIVQSNDDRGWRFRAKTDGHFYLQSSYIGVDTDRFMIRYDNGNVGIGTTSPTRTLDVRGSANIQSSGSILLLVTGSQGELLKVQDSGSSLGTLAVISSATTNVATFTTSSVIISGSLLVSGSTHGIAEHMILAISDETTNITTGTAKVTFRAPFAMTLTQIPRASLSTASTSGLVTVDINEAGTSILGANKLSIDANELTSTTAATPTTLADTSIADDAQITIDIDGAGTGARGLKVTLYYVKV